MCLIAENNKARLMKISSEPEQYEVIGSDGIRPFNTLNDAQYWFDLISE